MLIGDSLVNLVSGLGTERDKSAHGRFVATWLDKAELDALYAGNWLAQTIVDAPAEDMTRRWRRWNGGPRQISRLEASEKRLRLRAHLTRALKMARLYGGAGIVLGDGASDPSRPMDVDRLRAGGLKYLTTLSRFELGVGPLLRDPMDEFHGEPEWYEVGALTGKVARLHPSRVVRFLGLPPLEPGQSIDGWGTSILQACYDPIRNATSASNGQAALVTEAKVDVIKVPGLTQNAGDAAWRGRVLMRFGLANTGKSLTNALLLDKEEEWDHKQVNLANLPDVVRSALEEVAGAADIPLTRFLGTSARGLNATGEGDTRNYYDALASSRANDVDPGLERIDEALIRSALGARPADTYPTWNSLWQMDERVSAEIAAKKAGAIKVYAEAGVMPPSALRRGVQNMLMEDGILPGLDGALDDAKAAGEADAPLVGRAGAKPGGTGAGAPIVET